MNYVGEEELSSVVQGSSNSQINVRDEQEKSQSIIMYVWRPIMELRPKQMTKAWSFYILDI